MRKLISLSLFIPLVSFGQLTLETMSNINDSQSFKRVMIENGLIDFTSVITVSEDGNTITEFISDDEIFNASRTSLSNPCE